MRCPQCNHKNDDGVSNCEECGFPFVSKDSNNDLQELLAQIDEELELEGEDEEEFEGVEVTLSDPSALLPLRLGSLAQIREIIQGAIDGSVPEEDLKEMIEDFQEIIDYTLEEMDQMVFSPQMYEVVKKAVSATRKAFELYDNTLGELRQYFIDRDPVHLETGLELEGQANMYLSNAFNQVRETMTNMLGF